MSPRPLYVGMSINAYYISILNVHISLRTFAFIDLPVFFSLVSILLLLRSACEFTINTRNNIATRFTTIPPGTKNRIKRNFCSMYALPANITDIVKVLLKSLLLSCFSLKLSPWACVSENGFGFLLEY